MIMIDWNNIGDDHGGDAPNLIKTNTENEKDAPIPQQITYTDLHLADTNNIYGFQGYKNEFSNDKK